MGLTIMTLAFCLVMIFLHFYRKLRLSTLWVMIITLFVTVYNVMNASAAFSISDLFSAFVTVAGSVAGLFMFGYQNIFPHDNWSFHRYYTEKAKKLIGGRRLVITGLCGTIAGVVFSASGLVLLECVGNSFFGADKDQLAAATAATLGLNVILGLLGAMVLMLLAVFGAGCFLLGDIMLTNGLIRSNLVLMEKSGERVMHIVLSSVPVVNIIYAFVRLKATNAVIKAEIRYADELLKGENR